MSIIRSKRTQNFTIISNKVYEKHALSWQAMGMLGYLLSKPDDWRVVVPELVNVTKDTKKQTGREGVYNILKELEEKGYLIRKRNHDGTVESFIFDEPQPVELESAKPNQGEPNKAKPKQAKPDVLISTERQQELNNKKDGDEQSREVEPIQISDLQEPESRVSDNPMFANWQPDDLDTFRQQLRRAMLPNWESEQIQLALVEFTSYWQTRSETNSNSGWAHKFLQNLMRLKAQGAMAAKATEPSHRRFADKTTTPATTPAATLGMRPLGKM